MKKILPILLLLAGTVMADSMTPAIPSATDVEMGVSAYTQSMNTAYQLAGDTNNWNALTNFYPEAVLSGSHTNIPTSEAVEQASYPRQIFYGIAQVEPERDLRFAETPCIVPFTVDYDVNSGWVEDANETNYVVAGEQNGHWLRVSHNIMVSSGGGETFTASQSWMYRDYGDEIHHQWYGLRTVPEGEFALRSEVVYQAAQSDRILVMVDIVPALGNLLDGVKLTTGDYSDGTYFMIEDLGPDYRRTTTSTTTTTTTSSTTTTTSSTTTSSTTTSSTTTSSTTTTTTTSSSTTTTTSTTSTTTTI